MSIETSAGAAANAGGFACPACGFRVFNRRNAACESCGAALPPSLLYTDEDLRSMRADGAEALGDEVKHREKERLDAEEARAALRARLILAAFVIGN